MHAFTFSVYINNNLLSVCLDGYSKSNNRVTIQRTDLLSPVGVSALKSTYREFENDFCSALLLMQAVTLQWQRLAISDADISQFSTDPASF
jgi:hypothetical protein